MGSQTGPHGLYVASHVEMELNSATDRAPTHLLPVFSKHVYVPLEYGHQ